MSAQSKRCTKCQTILPSRHELCPTCQSDKFELFERTGTRPTKANSDRLADMYVAHSEIKASDFESGENR